MRFVRRFWYLIAVFGLLLAATFLIQVTKGNIVSNFFIEWASVWSTFISATAALLIVIMAVTTYWQERKIRLWAVQDKIREWVMNLFDILGELNLGSDEEVIITEQQRKSIVDIIVKSTNNAPEIIRLAEKYAPEIRDVIRDVAIAVALIDNVLLESPINRGKIIQMFHSMSDDIEEILRYKFI